MAGRSKSKKRSKTKIRTVQSLPKKAEKGEIVEMKIAQRDGKLRTQKFKATDQLMWKMIKN